MDEVDGTGTSLKNDGINNGMSLADNSEGYRQGSLGETRNTEQSILSETSTTSDGISSSAGLGERTDNVDRPHNNDRDSLSAEKLITEEKAVSKDAAFVMSEEILQACFEEACNSGSGFASGKTRIYHALNEDLTTVTEKANFLKKEYGIGGCSWDFKPYPKKDDKFRKYLAERCNLIGAVRLPNTAFKVSAGTDVISDIIFLQKRETMTIETPNWVNLSQTEDGIPINSYFAEHPKMMLGKMTYDTRIENKKRGVRTWV